MKNDNFINAFFNRRASVTIPNLIALTAGLAVGASLGVLFAPKSGRKIRERIRDLAKCTSVNSLETPVQECINQQENASHKRPKSDIKSLVHQAHTGAANAEEGLGA